MEIIIDDSYSISEIRQLFSRQFPYLKLEFFEYAPGSEKIFSKNNLITDTQKTLEQVRHIHINGHLSINGHQKAGTLEKHMQELGLAVKVFKKSGEAWIQISQYDHRTLSDHNKESEKENSLQEEVAADFEQYYEQM